jgi:hypothetical protein
VKIFSISAVVLALLLHEVAGPLQAQQPVKDIEAPARPLPLTHNCIKTTIKQIGSRLVSADPKTGKMTPIPNSGYEIAFNGSLPDPYMGSLKPTVVFYQGDPADKLVAQQRQGGSVQVCAVAYPDDQAATNSGSCNPTTDDRGRSLRVYDYRLGFAYIGPNAEHDCGGA